MDWVIQPDMVNHSTQYKYKDYLVSVYKAICNDNMIVVLVIKQKRYLNSPLFVYRCMYVFMLDMIDVFEKYQHLMFV
jgi:hypothetical protein